MREEMSQALYLVLRDLRRTSFLEPIILDGTPVDRGDGSDQQWITIGGTGGGLRGLTVLAAQSPVEQLVAVADQLQEWAVEELWRLHEPATWPTCPAHPGTHPMEAVLVDDEGVWRCPAGGDIDIPIGRLPAAC